MMNAAGTRQSFAGDEIALHATDQWRPRPRDRHEAFGDKSQALLRALVALLLGFVVVRVVGNSNQKAGSISLEYRNIGKTRFLTRVVM